MLVVFTFFSILAVILLPPVEQAARRGKSIVCISNQRQLGVALAVYADSFYGAFPHTDSRNSTGTATYARRSMEAFVDGLGGDIGPLYCPEFWHNSLSATYKTGLRQTSYVPGGGLIWGYDKWAGTRDMAGIQFGSWQYSRYADWSKSGMFYPPAPDPAYRNYPPGYQRMQSVLNATYRTISRGNSYGNGTVLMRVRMDTQPSSPLPAGRIAVFTCSNNISSRGWSASHSLIEQRYNPPTEPPIVHGSGESFADGHAEWYDAGSGLLYWIRSGQSGGGAIGVEEDK